MQASHLTFLDDRDELTRAVLPSLVLNQILQFRRAVTRMLRSVRDDLLLTFVAPHIDAPVLWTSQVLHLFESLLVEETGVVAPR